MEYYCRETVVFDVYAKELPCLNIMHYIMHYSAAFVGRILVSQDRKAWILLFVLYIFLLRLI